MVNLGPGSSMAKAECKNGKVGEDTKRPKLKSYCKEPHKLMKKFGL